ncbi:MAG TPA: hypothetical protein VN829_16455, partial [Dongiaceae bacterium]|nr:hypothetical protein [Dongiaceae bacterium]
MRDPVWIEAIKASADPQRAKHRLDALEAAGGGPALSAPSPEQARILAALFSGSEALSALLAAQPRWLGVLEPASLKYPRRKQGLGNEVAGWLKPLLARRDYALALERTRQFKQRELLRIGARDLARLGDVTEITRELSGLADVCLDAVWQVCHGQLAERYGSPAHQDASGRWQTTAGCVLGLGKLGGQELNYSSDVDVIFVYSEEGSVFKGPPNQAATPPPVLSNHQFFNRLAESFIAEVSRLTAAGSLYRIDLRLRPEGDAGPLGRSLESYENYYAQWGQTWERMMLIKARPVAGDAALGAEFLEMIQPFRYPRSVNQSVLREVAAVKDRIESEVVKAGELERNVKLGRGGIREIEFIAQSQQVLHAGRQPFLQGAETLACLAKLAQYEHLSGPEARKLAVAYCFLRQVEHRLQMENNLQTHTLPAARHALERLARLMGLATLRKFEAARRAHTGNVRRIFRKLLRAETPPRQAPSPFPRQFAGAEAQWKQFLSDHSFRDVDSAFRVLREFVEGPGYIHVSPRTSELACQLLPRLFRMTRGPLAGPAAQAGQRLSDPDRVVTRLDSFIGAYGARATLFELWNSNPAVFDLLLRLFDRSEFLAELAIRAPGLVDELVASGRLRLRKTAPETLRDLRHGLADPDQHLWLRNYHQAELMRIGLRDILGLADPEQYLTELSALAEA